jgi:hypothetical protein
VRVGNEGTDAETVGSGVLREHAVARRKNNAAMYLLMGANA